MPASESDLRSSGAGAPLRVCYFGTYRANYARNQLVIEGLRRNGVEITECHATLWHGIEDRVRVASGGWLSPVFLFRALAAYARLLLRYARVGHYDVLLVGYPGQMDVFLARLLSWIRRKPLVWDVLNSLYLICVERGIAARYPRTVRLIRGLEKTACRLPDHLVLDSAEFASWFQVTHGVSPDRVWLVPIGADDRTFRPAPRPASDESEAQRPFRAVYFGSYIPNHGVEYIVEAARLLVDDPAIQFVLIGTGPDREKAESLARSYRLPNVAFVDWLEQSSLIPELARADVCLGGFGTTPQALLTGNNKVMEGLAMGRPVITGYSPALPKSLQHGVHLYLCERGNPQGLAEAIRVLKADPELQTRLAANGRQAFVEQFSVTALGSVLAAELRGLST
jgi:glycosyltransferase involved in cell wall biosynthesis